MRLLINKAQSAVEYLVIISITLMLLLPVVYIFFNYSKSTQSTSVDAQAVAIGNTILDAAEKVYYSGKDSKLVVEVTVPEEAYAAHIYDNRELAINISKDTGESEIVFFTDINITSSTCVGSICILDELASPGLKKIRLQSISNGKQVLITSE